MSNHVNHRRRGRAEKRTEHGPTWRCHNSMTPSAGCNSTHVAKGRRWWQNFARRSERRTGKTSKSFRMGQPRRRPEINDTEVPE
jgi:hypothetical protein